MSRTDIFIHRGMARDARMYPSYTLADLKKWLDNPNLDPQTRAKAEAEIKAREEGTSKTRTTPQIMGGKVQTKVDRL